MPAELSTQEQAVFWRLVPESPASFVTRPRVDVFEERFRRLDEDGRKVAAAEFLRSYRRTATNEMWGLASLLTGSPLSDDGFSYFIRWLILQGREAFEGVILAPDEISAMLGFDGVMNSDLSVESLGSIEQYATAAVKGAASPKAEVSLWPTSKPFIRLFGKFWALVS